MGTLSLPRLRSTSWATARVSLRAPGPGVGRLGTRRAWPGDHRHLIGQHGCGAQGSGTCPPRQTWTPDLLPSEDHAAQGLASPRPQEVTVVPGSALAKAGCPGPSWTQAPGDAWKPCPEPGASSTSAPAPQPAQCRPLQGTPERGEQRLRERAGIAVLMRLAHPSGPLPSDQGPQTPPTGTQSWEAALRDGSSRGALGFRGHSPPQSPCSRAGCLL